MRLIAILIASTVPAAAYGQAYTYTSTPSASDSIAITGRALERARITGSANFIGDVELERFEYDDIHRILSQVPGVYVRGEDGYGLRPNIGLRGASSDRSAKLALMEDGVLLGPAPYSAPAAYFFPLSTRMTGIEVFKGPASIRYGPNTIGGALNMQTRDIPEDLRGGLDVGLGKDRFGKLHGWWGTSGDDWGVLLEGVHLRSDGFKDLDTGGNTGFAKNEIMAKGRYHTDPAGELYHRLDVKLGFADEMSHETYLGITDADFAETPNRRYAASQNDLMRWHRTQAQLRYSVTADLYDARLTIYRHDFHRVWTKFNRLEGVGNTGRILAAPGGANAVHLEVLRGDADSDGRPQHIVIGTNDRAFFSQGVDATGHWRPQWFDAFEQQFELGVRLHQDRIVREHTEQRFEMRRGVLVEAGRDAAAARNIGSATALAIHLLDEITIDDLVLTPGVRAELIWTGFRDRLHSSIADSFNAVVVPGIGAFYQLTPWLGVLAGVHRGFSPVSPGQHDAVKAETSINYEAGGRLKTKAVEGELIGFFNDYANLTGECTFSSGCPDDLLNAQFNGGEVFVYGLESTLKGNLRISKRYSIEGELSYTLTLSEFQTAFDSRAVQFEDVEIGDRLAYVPEHQGSLRVSLMHPDFAVNVAVQHTGAQRDKPGQGEIADAERIDAHAVVDLSANYLVVENGQLYATIDNLFNTAYITSRRPLGARPGKPFQLFVGYKHDFGE